MSTNSITAADLEKKAKTTYYGADALYETAVDLYLKDNDYASAMKAANKIWNTVGQSNAFLSIVKQCPDPAIQQKAASKIFSWTSQDQAYSLIVSRKLEKKDFEGAYEVTKKIPGCISKDAALLSIVQQTADLKLAEKAVREMNGWYSEDRNKAVELVIDRMLEKKDFSGAFSLLSIFVFFSDLVGKLFSKILGKMEEKGLNKDDLKMIEEATARLTYSKQKEVFKKLIDQYKTLSDTKEVERLEAKISKITDQQTDLIQQHRNITQIYTDFFPPTLLLMATFGAGYLAASLFHPIPLLLTGGVVAGVSLADGFK